MNKWKLRAKIVWRIVYLVVTGKAIAKPILDVPTGSEHA